MPPKQSTSKNIKFSKPIPIGSHHTVSGHEAMDLAKRLSEELAVQAKQNSGSLEGNRPITPDNEPRSRSYELRHQKSKGIHFLFINVTTILIYLDFKNRIVFFKL